MRRSSVDDKLRAANERDGAHDREGSPARRRTSVSPSRGRRPYGMGVREAGKPAGCEDAFDPNRHHHTSIPIDSSERSKSGALPGVVGAERALIGRPVHPAFDPTGLGPWGNDRSRTPSVYGLDRSDKHRQDYSDGSIKLDSSVQMFTRADSDVSNYVAQAPSAGAKDTDKDASKAAEAIEARSDGPEMLKSSFDQLPAGTHCIGEHAELFKSPFNPLPPTPAVGAVVSPARVNVWNMFFV
jgi:hypothetical protein